MIRKVLMIMSAITVAIIPTVTSAGGPNEPACTEKAGPGATALRGTIAVAVPDATARADTNADFTLRLERGGAVAFFRASVVMQIFARNNENVLCDLLQDNESVAAQELRTAILTTFGFPTNARFVVTDRSVSKAEVQGPKTAQWLCDQQFTKPVDQSDHTVPNCAAPRGSGMADITIYVQ